MEGITDGAEACTQARYRDGISRCGQVGWRRWLEQDRRRATLARLLDETQTVRAETGDRDEGIARADFAAVHHQSRDFQIGANAADIR